MKGLFEKKDIIIFINYNSHQLKYTLKDINTNTVYKEELIESFYRPSFSIPSNDLIVNEGLAFCFSITDDLPELFLSYQVFYKDTFENVHYNYITTLNMGYIYRSKIKSGIIQNLMFNKNADIKANVELRMISLSGRLVGYQGKCESTVNCKVERYIFDKDVRSGATIKLHASNLIKLNKLHQ